MVTLLYLLVLVIAITSIAADRKDTQYCQTFTLVCPEESKYFLNGTHNWLCAGPHTYECTNVEAVSIPTCVSGESVVETKIGKLELKDVQIGQHIRDIDGSWTVVLGWLHRDPVVSVTYRTVNGHVALSDKHLVPLSNGSWAYAEELQEGDYLYGDYRVTWLDTVVHHGAFAPFTESGTFRVGPVPLSCYAYTHLHHWAHWYVTRLYHWGLWHPEDATALSPWFRWWFV